MIGIQNDQSQRAVSVSCEWACQMVLQQKQWILPQTASSKAFVLLLKPICHRLYDVPKCLQHISLHQQMLEFSVITKR